MVMAIRAMAMVIPVIMGAVMAMVATITATMVTIIAMSMLTTRISLS